MSDGTILIITFLSAACAILMTVLYVNDKARKDVCLDLKKERWRNDS
jgi:hypothetical protein